MLSPSQSHHRRRRFHPRPRALLVLIGLIILAGLEAALPTVRWNTQTTVPTTVAIRQTPFPQSFHTLAKSAVLSVSGGPILFSFQPNRELPIASTTKIMTAYLLLRDPALSPGHLVTVNAKDIQDYQTGLSQGDSEVPIHLGQKIPVSDLFWALMLPSADDAAQILARADTGSLSAFVAQMNRTAEKMGMRHTHYVDPDGVSPRGYSTADDLLHLTEQAMDLPAFRKLVSTKSAPAGPFGRLTNLNQLLSSDPYAIGVKTGWTTKAGSCLVFAQRIGQSSHILYGVVLGEPGFPQMFADVRQLLATGSQLSQQTVIAAGQAIATITPDPSKVSLPVSATRKLTAWSSSATATLSIHWRLPSPQPLHAGETVATLSLSQPGWPTQTEPLTVMRGYRPPWFSRLKL